ncbi:MAG: tyrosine--tRNA ligase [Phycisphaeraceae bacterium]|nr:MAG: tyrosine--tRNA ligase [Phycisphaeraceae bacterium]
MLTPPTTPTTNDFLAEMTWRGLIHQTTGQEALAAHLAARPRKGYVGFDPTAPSLTIGNLVGILALVRFAKAGHTPVVVVGGATGLIGDPSGKEKERELNTPQTVAANVEGQRRIFDAVWANAGLGTPTIRNNYDWFKDITFLQALRDIGKHFSVNMMIQKESVKERLTNRDQGISYTEFSYMLLQAYDFKHLWAAEGVTLQMGGSDQFGNIVCGGDLIRRADASIAQSHLAEDEIVARLAKIGFENTPEKRDLERQIESIHAARLERMPHGLTWPLVTKADGGKFGKTESGAVWLTADRTSPYAFYQFWLNTADADLPRFLRTFTLLPREEIEALEAAHAANPGAREAHRALARHLTALLHGNAQADLAEHAAKALFSGDVASLPLDTLEHVMAGVPSSTHDKAALHAGVPLAEFLVTTALAASKREAREFLTNGSVLVNGRKAAPDDTLTTASLLHGSLTAIRRGKKNWHLARWS